MENVAKESMLRNVFNVAKRSKLNGNLAYGCLLVDENNNILLEGENSVLTDADALGHAEINLIREASKLYSADFLNKCTIYTSDEPCPMCSSAIFWGGIGKLVFGLSKSRFYQEFGRENPAIDFDISSRNILSAGGRKVIVEGPFLEDEALLIHK
jgi:tRNA(Arg) A34 adenosine deaminase TadA